ncbi:hypothetical protein VaNZ11_001249 [Volvox africanus]|uniref:SET domain-containing protein n=1 Tax=Volvox africanus TaxID=51714 RepID=A0ABQ5RQ91_9CHLO|nr:hypothetical protein VaNZ11_001249 [Volvox africanus]
MRRSAGPQWGFPGAIYLGTGEAKFKSGDTEIVGSRSLGTSLLLMALYTLPVDGAEAPQEGLTRSYLRDAAAAAAGEAAPTESAAAAFKTSTACIPQPPSSCPNQAATLSSSPLVTPSTPMPLMMMALIQMTNVSWASSDVTSSLPSSSSSSASSAPAPAPASSSSSSPDVNHDYRERRSNGSDGGPRKAMRPDRCSMEAGSRGAASPLTQGAIDLGALPAAAAAAAASQAAGSSTYSQESASDFGACRGATAHNGGEGGGSGSYTDPFGGNRVDAGRGPVTGGQLRMLVPMLDMINHSSVPYIGGYTDDDIVVAPGANVRWELRPPAGDQRPTARSVVDSCRGGTSGADNGLGQGQLAQRTSEERHGDDERGDGGAGGIGSRSGWQIALVATADLAIGQELLMCYDTTASNDSFALHYGFVETPNPNEDVQLFESLEDALAWHREVVLTEASAPASGLITKGGSLAAHRMKSLGPDELATWYDTTSAAAAAAAVAASMACGDCVAEITSPVKVRQQAHSTAA